MLLFPFLFREKFPSHFKFKEYCPLVFRHLRERFNIDDQEFAVSEPTEKKTTYTGNTECVLKWGAEHECLSICQLLGSGACFPRKILNELYSAELGTISTILGHFVCSVRFNIFWYGCSCTVLSFCEAFVLFLKFKEDILNWGKTSG